MNEFVIMTDSSCDLPSDIVNDLQISVLPLSVNIKGDEYKNYLDERDIKFDEFYKRIREGELAKTSAVNVDVFLNEMETGCKNFNELRKENADHLIEKVGEEIRSSFVWGNGDKIIDRNRN